MLIGIGIFFGLMGLGSLCWLLSSGREVSPRIILEGPVAGNIGATADCTSGP
jgi:hypothetical protein